MRVLLVNLKHFYQCRALWLFYVFFALNLLILGAMSLVLHPLRGSAGAAGGVSSAWMGVICAGSLAVGAMVGTVQMGIISAPLSFCLPDHRNVLRRLILLVGLVPSLLVLSLEFAKNPPTSLSPACLFGVSLTAYFGGVSISLSRFGPGTALGVILLLLTGGTMLNLGGSKEFVATTASAGAAILLGVVSAVAVWRWLGRTDLFRRRCGRPWLLWDPATREKYLWPDGSSRRRPMTVSRGDRFLLGIVTRCREGGAAQYLWGWLYTWLLPGAKGRFFMGWTLLLGVGTAALAWYMPDRGPFLIAYMVVLPGAVLGHPPLHSSLLVAGGRRERFLTTMASIVILGAILTLSAMLAFEMVGLVGVHTFAESRHAEAPGLPEFLRDRETPMSLRLVVLLLALFPLSRLLEVKLHRKRFLMGMAQMTPVFPVAWLNSFRPAWLPAVPAGYVALAFFLSWVLCAYGVYRVAMRSDLVRR